MQTAMFPSGLLTMFLASVLSASLAAEEFPGERWTKVTPAEAGLDAAKLNEARDYALTGGVSTLTQHDDLLERKTSPKKTVNAKGGQPAAAPYPPSPVITGIQWAPASSIVRKARGGDNWPITWADDGRMIHLVFSGDDHFSVRQATLTTSR